MYQARLATPAVLVALLASFASCGALSPSRSAPSASPGGAGWRYDVSAGEGARELAVEAAFDAGTLPDLGVHEGAERFVRDVEVHDHGRWRHVEPTNAVGATWRIPSCSKGCRIRYRFDLEEAARVLADVDTAAAFGDTVVSPPSTWLLHPAFAAPNTRFRMRVTTSADRTFATGVYPTTDQPNTYEADAAYLPVAPYSAFGALNVTRVQHSGSVDFQLAMPVELGGSKDDLVRRWIARSSRAVSSYFGCFPVPRVLVLVMPVDGDAVTHGHALGDGGATIVLEVGRDVTQATLDADWVLTHEMVHMGFPSVSQRQHWMEEGVAVYVEPLARLRVGVISAETMWRDLSRGLPKGLPRDADRGLDNTRSWGRTYWGGALFCLLADIAIRERTGNRYSFEDALRGIVAEGGNIAVVWDFDRVLDAGDRAVGVPVLRELHAKMGARPSRVDIEALLTKLGVAVDGENVTFDDAAPLAAVRRGISSPSEPPELARIMSCPSRNPSDRFVEIARRPRARVLR